MTPEQGARILAEDWLQLRREEVVHYITDETRLPEARAFLAAAERAGAVTKLTVLDSGAVQEADAIEAMRGIMSYANVIVGATNYSFVTTDAVQYALARGARFLSLPLSTNDGSSLLTNDFLAMDPGRAAALARPMVRALERSDTIRVTTALGTDITFSKAGRKTGVFTGRAARPGTCASASFEVYVPVVEDSACGRVVLDGSLGYLGLVRAPLALDFAGGRLVRIADTADGARLRAYLDSFADPEMTVAAEFGIGLNECARCRGVAYIEDESAAGTFHIGFGRNLALGGRHDAAGHFDLVTRAPTITAGKTTLMRAGVRAPSALARLLGRAGPRLV